MGYHTQQKPVRQLDFSKMKAKTMEKKVVIREYMYEYREKIRELRQRLYQLIRMTDGKSV